MVLLGHNELIAMPSCVPVEHKVQSGRKRQHGICRQITMHPIVCQLPDIFPLTQIGRDTPIEQSFQ